MNPYSNDLRRRVVDAYESGEHTQAEVAELFNVSLASVKTFLRRNRETGSPDALPHAGGRKPSLTQKARLFVQATVEQDNDLTLDDLRRRLKAKHKKVVSRPTLCRLLQSLDLPRKKSRSTPVNATRPEFNKPAPSMPGKSGNST
jgi:transposase